MPSPAFAAAASVTQDSSGTPARFYDNSNYSDNAESYSTADFVRSFLVYDSANNLLDTISLPGSTLSVTMTVSRDQYLRCVLQLEGIGIVGDYTKTVNVGLERYTDNAMNKLLLYGCDCDVPLSIVSATNKGIAYMYGASKALIYGNGPGYDRYITAAYNNLNYNQGR